MGSIRLGWTVLAVVTLYQIIPTDASIPHRKFEYKYSFKPPYLAQKDGSVPFWVYGGNAIASAENVRVAPSLRSQKGAIWSKSKTNFDWWEAEIVFRVTGRGRIGADGLAFWYTENHGDFDGNVFGSSDKWVGLGVFFDSFDNDNKHNNPYIMAMVNDGTKEFDHANDGSSQMLSGCVKDFRNKPFPTRAKIEYYMNTLTVLFHNGMTNNDEYEICLRVENLHLPRYGYFGLSAATGGLADDHDVIQFLTTSLYPPGQAPVAGQAGRVSPEDETKLSQEYADYQKKLEQQQEEYKKEHPGAQVKDADTEFEDWFESDSQRELRQIFSGQSQIYDQVRLLSQKLDEVVGRQERALGLLSALHQGGGQIASQPGAPPPQIGQQQFIDTIRRQEVDALLTNQNTMITSAREIRNFIVEISNKLDRVMEKQDRGTGTAQVMGYDSASIVNEVRDALNEVKRDTGSMAQRLTSQGPSAGSCPSCVTPLILLFAIAAHLIIIFGYFMYRDNKENQAKKFY
ncbi:Legume-like lectin family [Nesidiocoris tenuis]|uniref:Legume-like lectin family n=1 Tax=Nesidiocoris tenuis TaxID=355587 RepID=A0ABN7AZC4_9HEMI|nr:Legume-like lectin family [Nesidiocoris tenuis]